MRHARLEQAEVDGPEAVEPRKARDGVVGQIELLELSRPSEEVKKKER